MYNIFLAAFSLGFFVWGKNKLIKSSAAFLLLCALSGILMYFFPQDPINITLTFKGLIHFFLAGMAAITTLLAVFLSAFGFGKMDGYKNLKVISVILGLIIFISGPLTAIGPTKFPAYFGIAERITIGAFILWLFLISLVLFIKSKKSLKK